jgi:hypothetical protein
MRRNKEGKNEEHSKESYVTLILLELYKKLSLSTTCDILSPAGTILIWNDKNKEYKKNNTKDPNLMVENDFDKCWFHIDFYTISSYLKSLDVPVVHFDIHGKLGQKKDD